MNYTLTTSPDQIKSVQDEEFFQFVMALLEMMKLEDIVPDGTTAESMTFAQKTEFNRVLSQNEIEIVDNKDGSFEILLQGNSIAKWHKPWISLRKNESERDPKKKIMAEIKFDFNSIYENQEE